MIRVRTREKSVPWEQAKGWWFHNHRDEVFHVTGVFTSRDRLYEVDVRDLADDGELNASHAYIPETFCELLPY